MSLVAITEKELADLVREKRFGAWALTFLAFWTIFLFFFIQSLQDRLAFGGGAENVVTLALPAFFFYAIGFAVLALFVLTDGITKERESGMLPVVASKPIVRWHVVFAKLLSGLAVYVASFLVTIPPALILTWAMGFPALELLTILYVGPFLALYTFILGLGLFLGVVTSSSKVAIGTAAGIYLPLFFTMSGGPLSIIYRRFPAAQSVAAYSPFEAALDATQVAMFGGQMPWGPIFVTVAFGIGFAALAFWIFSRQEAAA